MSDQPAPTGRQFNLPFGYRLERQPGGWWGAQKGGYGVANYLTPVGALIACRHNWRAARPR